MGPALVPRETGEVGYQPPGGGGSFLLGEVPGAGNEAVRQPVPELWLFCHPSNMPRAPDKIRPGAVILPSAHITAASRAWQKLEESPSSSVTLAFGVN